MKSIIFNSLILMLAAPILVIVGTFAYGCLLFLLFSPMIIREYGYIYIVPCLLIVFVFAICAQVYEKFKPHEGE